MRRRSLLYYLCCIPWTLTIIAIVAVILLSRASGAEPPRYTVESKLPTFTVTNRLPPTATGVVVHQPAQPRREYWQGYGWVEWRDGSWWAVQAAPVQEVRQSRPFPVQHSTPTTSATGAVGFSTSSPGSTVTGRIHTYAVPAGIPGSIENCASPFG